MNKKQQQQKKDLKKKKEWILWQDTRGPWTLLSISARNNPGHGKFTICSKTKSVYPDLLNK